MASKADFAPVRGLDPTKPKDTKERLLNDDSFVDNDKHTQSIANKSLSNIESVPARIGMFNCMFMLFSGAMGAGVLGLPTVVRHNGYFWGLFLITVGGIFSAVSEYYLIKCTRVANEDLARKGKKTLDSYSSLMQYAAAKCWPGKSTLWVKLMLNFMFVFYIWFGVIVSMTQFIFAFADGILDAQTPDERSAFYNFVIDSDSRTFQWWSLAILGCIWFALCIPKDLSCLKYIALYPFGTIMLSVVMVTVFFFIVDPSEKRGMVFDITSEAAKNSKPTPITEQNDTISTFSLGEHGIIGVFALSGRFVFAYMTHTNVVTCAAALENTSDRSAMYISGVNVACIIVFYSLICLMTVLVQGTFLVVPFTKFYVDSCTNETVNGMARVLNKHSSTKKMF